MIKLEGLIIFYVANMLDGADTSNASTAPKGNLEDTSMLQKAKFTMGHRYQLALDRMTPHPKYRWIGTTILIFLYVLRAATVGGFYIVSYALGIYLLNLLIGFLAPKIDPETILAEIDDVDEDDVLPTKDDGEFKPFIRKLNEFKFW